ncbi:hypothetical protein MBLNU459_g1410t1 [Dothideomycetes sp. NU459]
MPPPKRHRPRRQNHNAPSRAPQVAPSTPLAPPPRPILAPESAGTVAWRRKEQPRETLILPRDTHFTDLKDLKARRDQIAVSTETYITCANNPRPAFLIWGTPSKVEEAKALLNVWIADNPVARRAVNQKPVHHNYEGRKQHEKMQAIEDRKMVLQRPPLPDTSFESIANFVWPFDEYSPDEVLEGPTFKVLDPIRIDHNCTIFYDYSTHTFRVMGKHKDVLEAVTRVRGTFFQIKARETSKSSIHLLHWASLPEPPTSVDLIPYKDPDYMQYESGSKEPGLLVKSKANAKRLVSATAGSSSSTEADERKDSKKDRASTIAEDMKEPFMKTVPKLRYYRGNLTVRLRLGTFRIGRWDKKRDNGLKSFESMVKDPNFAATVSEHIGDEQIEAHALNRIRSANGFLTSSSWSSDLSEVVPIYTAALTVDANDGRGSVVLTKVWQEHDGFFNEISKDWSRLHATHKGGDAPSMFLDLTMTDLKDGLSWNLEISASSAVNKDKLPVSLQNLADYNFNIIEEKARDIDSSDRWCEFERDHQGKPKPVQRKQALSQRIAWQFDIARSGYTVEVVKIQSIKYTPGLTPGREVTMVYEPRWGVNVTHRNWDMSLAQHTDLEIGRGASWTADLPTWFPLDDDDKEKGTVNNDGHVGMVRKLMRIQEIVCGGHEGV